MANKRKISIRTYFMLVFLTITFVSLGIYTILNYIAITEVFERELEVSLQNFALEIENSIDFSSLEEVYLDQDFLQEQDEIFRFSLNEVLIQVRDKSGLPIAKSKKLGLENLPYTKDLLKRLETRNKQIEDYDLTLDGDDKVYKVLSYMAPTNSPKFLLQIGVPQKYIYGSSISLIKGVFYFIPVLIAFSLLISYFLIRIAGKPILDLSNQVKALSLRDFSERIQSEFLFVEVNDLRLIINELLDKIQSYIASNERFISNASHQLKTPLSIIKSEVDLILQDGLDKNDEKLLSIRDEINILIGIVDKLLTLAKMDAENRKASFMQLQLDEVLIRAVDLVKKFALDHKVEFKVNIQSDNETEEVDLSLNGDEYLLISLFQSVLENAIKYSPQNSVVKINVFAKTDSLTVSILDEGPGIEDKSRDKLFERFYTSSDAKVKGTGLGLAVAKQVADLHNAKLLIQKRKHKGTEVLFEIKKI